MNDPLRAYFETEEGLRARYLTLLTDLRAASPSFFDAYLELAEGFFKNLLRKRGSEEKLDFTIGTALRKGENRSYLETEWGIGKKDIDSFLDRSKKLNRHKHQKEASIGEVKVGSYMALLYAIVFPVAKKENRPLPPYDPAYYPSLIGAGGKEYARLLEEKEALQDELSRSLYLSKEKQAEIASLGEAIKEQGADFEKKSNELLLEINRLKDIKILAIEGKLDEANKKLDALYGLVVGKETETPAKEKSDPRPDLASFLRGSVVHYRVSERHYVWKIVVAIAYLVLLILFSSALKLNNPANLCWLIPCYIQPLALLALVIFSPKAGDDVRIDSPFLLRRLVPTVIGNRISYEVEKTWLGHLYGFLRAMACVVPIVGGVAISTNGINYDAGLLGFAFFLSLLFLVGNGFSYDYFPSFKSYSPVVFGLIRFVKGQEEVYSSLYVAAGAGTSFFYRKSS